MRKFSYNYRNEMRLVERKSDGAELVQYRHDAGGREVWSRREWFAGRTDSFDTRFPLDVDRNGDNNSHLMHLSDAGMSGYDPTFQDFEFEEATWDGRLHWHSGGDIHYFDFYLHIPSEVEGFPDNYIGYVAYGDFAVHFFTDRTVCCWNRHAWDSSQPLYNFADAVPTGWRNVGIRVNGSGQGIDIYVDGSLFLSSTGSGNAIPDAFAWFGCHTADHPMHSMAVHGFASYRANPVNWEESWVPHPFTTVKGKDGPNTLCTVATESLTYAAGELCYAMTGSATTTLEIGIDGELHTTFTLVNCTAQMAARVTAECYDGTGNGIGVTLANLSGAHGEARLYAPKKLNGTHYSTDVSAGFNHEADSSFSENCFDPVSFWGEGNEAVGICVAAGGDGGPGAGGGTDFMHQLTVDDRRNSGAGDPVNSGKADDGHGCACRDNNPSLLNGNTGHLDATFGDDVILSDFGDIGDNASGLEFTLLFPPQLWGNPPCQKKRGEALATELGNILVKLETLGATREHWEEKLASLSSELQELEGNANSAAQELITLKVLGAVLASELAKGNLPQWQRDQFANAAEQNAKKIDAANETISAGRAAAQVKHADLDNATRERDAVDAVLMQLLDRTAEIEDEIGRICAMIRVSEELGAQVYEIYSKIDEISDWVFLGKSLAKNLTKEAIEQFAKTYMKMGAKGAARAAFDPKKWAAMQRTERKLWARGEALDKKWTPVRGTHAHGAPVYRSADGKYYSPDVDAHNGGVWKVGEVKKGKFVRTGTLNEKLERIGD